MRISLMFHAAWLSAILVAPAASEAQFYGNYQLPMPVNLQQFPSILPFAQPAVPLPTGPHISPLPIECYPQASAETFAVPVVSPPISESYSQSATPSPDPGASIAGSSTLALTPMAGAVPPVVDHRGDGVVQAGGTSTRFVAAAPTSFQQPQPSSAGREIEQIATRRPTEAAAMPPRKQALTGDWVEATQYFVPFDTNASAYRPKRRSTSGWVPSRGK